MTAARELESTGPWHRGITGYQWLVLLLASAGWVFDVYEGQIFNLTRSQLLNDILREQATPASVKKYGDVFLGVFLVGGALGGVLFGMLADSWGRRPTLIATILTYSLFSALTFFANSLWQVGVLRFLVAMGVGGEWSVAAALVAEVFPHRARAHAGAIFHATSVLGTWLAGLAAFFAGENWRIVYLLGALPALLILAIRFVVQEPAAPQLQTSARTSAIRELLTRARWLFPALAGLCLAAVGLGTFWAITAAGQDLAQDFLRRHGVTSPIDPKIAYGIIQATGGGLGLVAFGPLSARIGRKAAFAFFQVGAIILVPLTCYAPAHYWQLLVLLPIYGFLTLGMHAGFAVYFPELFPTRLRATGAGFCFNGGRLLAAAVLVFSGWLKARPGVDLRLAITLLSSLFVVGLALLLLLPETKGRPLPDE